MGSVAVKPLALITGASSGIGRAIALRLSRDGYRVLIHFHSGEEGARATLDAVTSAGGEGELIRFDVKDSSSIEAALEKTLEGRPIAALVNNAGIHEDTLAGLMTDESFDRVMRTNAYGAFYLMRYCVRKMIRARAGTIVNVASLAGQTGNAGQMNYAASKAALIAMTKTLAMEVGSRGIRVNAVSPGFIETPMLDDPQLKERLAELVKRVPLGRVGKSEEVAGAVSFLCSADAGYVTGHTLSVNGGLFPS